MIIKVKMLRGILMVFIIGAIISRTTLLLSNYGRDIDNDDYKGKKFTNASTLVLAYIATHLQTGDVVKDAEPPKEELMFKSIVALLIGTTVFTIFDKVWTDTVGDNNWKYVMIPLVAILAWVVVYFISGDTKLKDSENWWENMFALCIFGVIAIAIDIGLEHINYGQLGFWISVIVLLLDIAIICYLGFNLSNKTEIGNVDSKKWSVLVIGFVIVINLATLFYNAAKTDNSAEAEVGWRDILLSVIILIPAVIASGLLFWSDEKYNSVTKQVFYPLFLLYLVVISYSISSGYLNIMNYAHRVSIIAVFGFLMWSKFDKDNIEGLLRLIIFAGIISYIFGSWVTENETVPILFTMVGMVVASILVFKNSEENSRLFSNKKIDSIDILIVGSLLFAIDGATKTKTLDNSDEVDTQSRRLTDPDTRGRNFSIILLVVGVALSIMGEYKFGENTLWTANTENMMEFIPQFLPYLFGTVAVLIFIASQSITNFGINWLMIPLLSLIPVGMVANKLISRDNLKQLPKYLGGLVVVILVIALVLHDSVDIDTLIEWPLSTFSLGFYESVVPIADYNTPFGDTQGGEALTNLTNSELESKVIDANRSLLDRITFSTVGYRPSGSLQSGNFSYSLSFWCKIVDPSTDMVNQKEDFVYILRNGSEKMDSPGVLYSSSSNQLRVGTLVSNGVVEQYDIDNIPTHKWNHIVIVSEHRNLDTYLNGELVKSYMLNGVKAKMPADQLQVFPDFNKGKYSNSEITLVRTFPSALNMSQIKSIYKQNYLDSTPKKKWLWWMTPLWNPIKKNN